MWTKSIFVVALFTGAYTAFAEEEKATFRISHNVLSMDSIRSSSDPDGDAKEIKTTESKLNTFAGPWEILVILGKWNFYSYPSQTGSTFGLGYSFTDSIELDILYGVSNLNTKTDDDSENKLSSTYGLSLYYYLPVAPASLEFWLTPTLTSSSSKDIDDATGAETKVKGQSTSIALGVDYVMPIAKNFMTVTGLNYTMNSGSEKVGSAKTKTSGSALQGRLIGLRCVF